MGKELLDKHIFDQINVASTALFDYGFIPAETEQADVRAARITLALSSVAMRFASIERVPRYEPERRENDAEHSFMLALVAPELAHAFYPQLDAGLVHQYATYHDLIELETDDVATFLLDDKALAVKKAKEHAALKRLTDRLPPHSARMILAFEKQADPESRLVSCVDKLVPPAVDILGYGVQAMREDYQIDSIAKLNVAQANVRDRVAAKYGDEFPEIIDIHTLLIQTFNDVYASSCK